MPTVTKKFARGYQRPERGVMNKLEREYALKLRMDLASGLILDFRYEGLKVRLANNTFYTPDFFVQEIDNTISLVEIKGHWEEDARIKIKVAAEQWPMFRWVALTVQKAKDGGGWKREEF